MVNKKEQIRTNQCKGKTCSGNWLVPGTKLCDWCLLQMFNLKATYDSHDEWSMVELYHQEDVLNALRKATGL